MQRIGSLTAALMVVGLGAISLFVFFVVFGGVALNDRPWLTVVMAVIAVLEVVYLERVRIAFSDHQHEDLARRAHAMRERRGF